MYVKSVGERDGFLFNDRTFHVVVISPSVTTMDVITPFLFIITSSCVTPATIVVGCGGVRRTAMEPGAEERSDGVYTFISTKNTRSREAPASCLSIALITTVRVCDCTCHTKVPLLT